MYQFKKTQLPLPVANAKGSLSIKNPVNVFTEFSPCKSTIIGYMDESACLPSYLVPDDHSVKLKEGPYESFIIKKSQEVLNNVAEKLLNLGIEVVRPGRVDHSIKRKLGDKEEWGYHTFSARDLLFFYHDTIYYVPSFQDPTGDDIKAFKWISEQLRCKGATLMKSWTNPENKKDIPYFDAANILRVGLDIILLISVSGNQLGYNKLREHFEDRYKGRVRIHPFRNVDNSVHIDTTIGVIGWNEQLQKYLITADKSITTPTLIPSIFRGKNWAVIEITDKLILDFGVIPEYHVASHKLAENFFMIKPNLALVDEKQTKIIELFEFYGIQCIKTDNPYGREVSGAFHCMTNEWNREEEKDFNKVLDNPLNTENITEDDLAGYFDPELLKFLKGKGDLAEWTNICNKEGIYPTYVTDHLSEEDIKDMNMRHDEAKKAVL